MYPDFPDSPHSLDFRRLLRGTTADDRFLTGVAVGARAYSAECIPRLQVSHICYSTFVSLLDA